jgi:hypothetical protein
MLDVRGSLANILENMAGDILTTTSCPLFWGEVDLPVTLRKEVECMVDEDAM